VNDYLQKRVAEESRSLPTSVDGRVEPSDSVALTVASTLAGAAIDAVAPGAGLVFGLVMNFVGEPRPSTDVLKPDLTEAVYRDFFRRRPIRAFTPDRKSVERWDEFLAEHWD